MANYKIILTFRDILVSDIPKENIEGKVVIADQSKYFKLPIKEVINLELNNINDSMFVETTFIDSGHFIIYLNSLYSTKIASKKTLGTLNISIPPNFATEEEIEVTKKP